MRRLGSSRDELARARHIVGRQPEFRLFAARVHLEENIGRDTGRRARAAQVLGEPERVDRLNERESADDLRDLVRLEMPDEMPAAGKLHVGRLREKLLHLVLADVGEARLDRLRDDLGAVRLRDGDDRDGGGVAPRARGGARDPLPNALEILSDRHGLSALLPPGADPGARMLPSLHVQTMKNPVRDRGDEDADGRQKRDPREERVE